VRLPNAAQNAGGRAKRLAWLDVRIIEVTSGEFDETIDAVASRTSASSPPQSSNPDTLTALVLLALAVSACGASRRQRILRPEMGGAAPVDSDAGSSISAPEPEEVDPAEGLAACGTLLVDLIGHRFQIMTHEVTVGQFASCVAEGACDAPTAGEETEMDPLCRPVARALPDIEDDPVNCVTLADADSFCRSRGMVVPTVYEWQAAGDGTYPWGETEPTQEHARFGTGGGPSEVCAHPLGASSAGVHDLGGNVWEWAFGREAEPWLCGGSFESDISLLRVDSCHPVEFDNRRYPSIGFRCIRRFD